MKKSICLTPFFLLFIFFFAFSGCKKYEEGPAFSLRSKKARVANDWRVAKYLENGVDFTSDFNFYYQDGKITLSKSGVYLFTYKLNGTLDQTESGTWKFNSDKTELIITETSPGSSTWTWKIIRLKETELKVSETTPSGLVKEFTLLPF
jgi:hypothetical protein